MARTRNLFYFYGLAAAGAAFVALAAFFWRYTVDDAYISLRYARHVATGWGFVFNRTGPPVEGYTNFLWVVIEAGLFKVLPAAAVLPAAKLLGVVLGLGTLSGAAALARRLYGDAAAFTAAIIFGLTGNFAFWSVAGLETPLYLLCLVWGAYSLTRVPEGAKWGMAAAAWWLGAALTRPEGAVIAIAAFGLAAWLARGHRNMVLAAATAFVVSYGAYFIWRWQYFDSLFPNTFYARAGAGGQVYYQRAKEMAPFLLYAAIPTVAVLWRRTKLQAAATKLIWMLCALAFLLAFVAKREWMPGYRYELPFLTFLWVLAAGTALAGWERRKRFTKTGIVAAAAIYGAIASFPLAKELSYGDNLNRAHISLGKWLASATPAGRSLAAWDMGALPYYSDFPVVYDLNPEGLLSVATTRYGYNPEEVLRARPAFLVLYSGSYTRIDAPRHHWVWRVYRAGEFRRHYRYLFTFQFSEKSNLRVYARDNVTLSPRVFETGKAAALASSVR